METFEIDGHRVCLTTFYEEGDSHFPISYRMVCGCYNDQGKWTGEGFAGTIPIKDMVAWAIESGFVKFEARGD